MSAKRGREAIKWSAAALISSLFVLGLLIAQGDPPRVTYNGRAVEDWIRNTDWEKERTEGEIAILMLGEKAVEPLRAILRLKSPSWAVSMGWKVPMGNLVFSRPLKNVVKKQQAIRCLEAVGTLGPLHEPLLPDLIMMAENEKEFLRLRRMALRYIHRQMAVSVEKSNILVRLSTDASLRREAARYFQSFQLQRRNDEMRILAAQIDNRFDSVKQAESNLLSGTNSLFKEEWSLWETVTPERHL